MLEHLLSFIVARMAKVFSVSRSGFYYWIKYRHKAIQREVTRQELDTKVKGAFDNRKGLMAQDASRKSWLRTVIVVMLKPLPPV
ncbi:mobile element protein [Vibrio ponticus]|nr:mobile element protein [Vibrio ponticus]